MITENELLLDVIRFAPENSIWNISEDSWSRIPEIIKMLKISTLAYGWEIEINHDNRNQLLKFIDKYDLSEKIIHQIIISDNDVIFKSYDCMDCSFLKSNFPQFENLMIKYKCLDIMELN
jgi:hypothetical protein